MIGALAFGLDLSNTDWVGFVAMLLAIAIAMSAIGIATAAVVLVIQRGNTIAGLVIFAMSVISGAFFPVSVLPDWLEAIGKVMPTRFAFDGFRSALFEGSGWEDDFLMLAAFSAVSRAARGLALRPGAAHGQALGKACPVLTSLTH